MVSRYKFCKMGQNTDFRFFFIFIFVVNDSVIYCMLASSTVKSGVTSLVLSTEGDDKLNSSFLDKAMGWYSQTKDKGDCLHPPPDATVQLCLFASVVFYRS